MTAQKSRGAYVAYRDILGIQQGHRWLATYNDLQRGRGCPVCIDMVNGVRVSKPQRQLNEMLGGELNLPCGGYLIDVAVCLNGVNIAVEYDN